MEYNTQKKFITGNLRPFTSNCLPKFINTNLKHTYEIRCPKVKS